MSETVDVINKNDKESAIAEHDELQKSMERLNGNIEQLTKVIADRKNLPKENNVEVKDGENGKNTSRVAVTGALALIGFKLGGLIGGKLGFVYNLFKDSSFSKIEESNTKLFEQSLTGQFKHIGIGALIGGAIGTVLLGIVGWTRGDRIKDPGDLIKHPFESLGKIFGEEKQKKAVAENNNEVSDKNNTPSDHVARLQAEKNQQVAAASAAR